MQSGNGGGGLNRPQTRRRREAESGLNVIFVLLVREGVWPAPALRSGQIGVLDNLAAHKGERVRELVEAEGCELSFLPSYSPYFSPIEEVFSKIKALCCEGRRSARGRSSSRRSGAGRGERAGRTGSVRPLRLRASGSTSLRTAVC